MSLYQLQRSVLPQLFDKARVKHCPLAKLNKEPRPGLTQSHMVRNKNPRPPTAELPRQALLENVAPNMNVNSRKDVIQDKDSGARVDCSCERHSPLLPAAEVNAISP